jgi:squalene-hopene/tetraprenyl-beta-curcumene cyclase
VNTSSRLDQAIARTRDHLLSQMNEQGHWEGELSSSALSTATAIVALTLVDAEAHAPFIQAGVRWLIEHQNADGGWGDTTISKSNLSTTLLVWSALGFTVQPASRNQHPETSIQHCEAWIARNVGSLSPDAIAKAVIARYGKDKTFSVPILMMATLGGRLGEKAWRRVLSLPFELAVLPRTWFGAIGLPVVSYALPALIAIGHARFHHVPPAWWNPLRWIRQWAWKQVRPMLRELQPSTGGYLEATPLTSFVTMALAGAGEKDHPCVPHAVEFLQRSMRADGSWPIDTNLATWGTTLSIKALGDDLSPDQKSQLKTWLLGQQYQTIHPFTNAAPGGWAWTNLPGGVPDADDTAGTLIALWHLCENDDERRNLAPQASAGVQWLLDLQNRDGGMPTFCRGWGTLPFDRSAPELAAHALWAWRLWHPHLPAKVQQRLSFAIDESMHYLEDEQVGKAAWEPLWFGNEHAQGEVNRVYGTAQVCRGLLAAGAPHDLPLLARAIAWLQSQQQASGGWGGSLNGPPSLEETSVTMQALAAMPANDSLQQTLGRGADWLLVTTRDGTHFPSSPIGLYFARLWYHERLYPILWTLGALKAARSVLETKA